MTTFLDGYEQFAGSGSPAELINRAEYIQSGTWSIVQGRAAVPNSAALSGPKATLKRTFEWSGSLFSCGLAHKFAARGAVMWVSDGTADVTLWMNELTGLPTMNSNIGYALPVKNMYYYYEFAIDRSANTISLYINNKLDSSMALPASFAAATQLTVGFGWRAVTEYRPASTYKDDGIKTYDDFYARAGERLGPVLVYTRFPTSDENVEWLKANPTLSHSSSMSQHPPDPLDSYVASDQFGKEDRFKSTDPIGSTNPVLATAMLVMARKAPSLNAKLGVFMGGKPGMVAGRTAKVSLTDAWVTKYISFAEDSADTKEKIEASEFGINVATP